MERIDCDNSARTQEHFFDMPTLIRFLIVLIFLAGLVFGGMVALIALVEPEEEEVTVRVPTSDLLGE